MKTPAEIAIFGGGFDPFHCGHETLLNALAQLQSEGKPRFSKIIIVPSQDPPHKKPHAFSADLRTRFVEKFIENASKNIFELSLIELNRNGKSYAIETVTEISKQNPQSKLSWALGTDAFEKLHTWYKADELVAQCSFLVFTRKGASYIAPQLKDFRAQQIEVDLPNVSSSEIREDFNAKRDISAKVPKYVLELIA